VKPLFRNRFYAREQIAAAIRELEARELCRRLDESGIVHSLVAKNAEVIEDPQLIANGVIVAYETGLPGVERTFATPIRLSAEGQQPPRRAPALGEHTEAVLREHGYDDADLAKLAEDGVIATGAGG
jgi:crotonobetainyl-CoA:carnitine CoA-transferase CaiB-like acyl-CoA transferase